MPRTQNVQDWQAAEARIWAILEESARRHEKWEEEAKQREEEDKRRHEKWEEEAKQRAEEDKRRHEKWEEEVKQRAEEDKRWKEEVKQRDDEINKKIAALSDNIGGLNRST
ncbi:MAG: hypothetical protein LBG72_00080, partial [Spirochaetaceae bacterium]|nr:hypothetical protein [Spirochaetaceae bacterium]